MGFGDWNDAVGGIDREGRGQSVWTTMAYVFGLRNSAALLDHLGDPDAAEYRRRADELDEILNRRFFDGDRYIRAVTDDGRRIGSSANEEGRLWIEPQGWALFNGVADEQKATAIVAALRRESYVPYGVLLLSPPFTRYHADIGRITNDAPGIVENGSNYVQGMLFYTYGLTRANLPDEALKLLCRVLPTNPDNPPAHAQIEPFQITNSFQGPASRHPGRAMFSWRTGSAGWFLKTVWDGMLGILPDFDGVRIEAHLPAGFGDRVEVTRRIRGRDVRFDFIRKDVGPSGVRYTLRVQNGEVIPYAKLARRARVLVVCGAAR
jgi:cellobionic acid phosphorylase